MLKTITLNQKSLSITLVTKNVTLMCINNFLGSNTVDFWTVLILTTLLFSTIDSKTLNHLQSLRLKKANLKTYGASLKSAKPTYLQILCLGLSRTRIICSESLAKKVRQMTSSYQPV